MYEPLWQVLYIVLSEIFFSSSTSSFTLCVHHPKHTMQHTDDILENYTHEILSLN